MPRRGRFLRVIESLWPRPTRAVTFGVYIRHKKIVSLPPRYSIALVARSWDERRGEISERISEWSWARRGSASTSKSLWLAIFCARSFPHSPPPVVPAGRRSRRIKRFVPVYIYTSTPSRGTLQRTAAARSGLQPRDSFISPLPPPSLCPPARDSSAPLPVTAHRVLWRNTVEFMIAEVEPRGRSGDAEIPIARSICYRPREISRLTHSLAPYNRLRSKTQDARCVEDKSPSRFFRENSLRVAAKGYAGRIEERLSFSFPGFYGSRIMSRESTTAILRVYVYTSLTVINPPFPHETSAPSDDRIHHCSSRVSSMYRRVRRIRLRHFSYRFVNTRDVRVYAGDT